MSKPQIGLTLDCLAPNNYPGDNSGEHQHHTERFGFERVAGNDADDGETVGLLYRGWFGRGSSCCIGNLCPLDGGGRWRWPISKPLKNVMVIFGGDKRLSS